MKKILSTLILTVLTGAMALAQQVVVTGSVLDSLSREGEPAAILQFFKAPDMEKPIAFTTTDTDGKFSQTLTGKGGYRMLFSNMGRKTVTRDFTLDGTSGTVDLGTVLVQDDVQTLKAGTVTAQRPLVRMEIDKMTYDVEHDVDAKASTVLDMLRKVPMVSVDGQDNITVNGSSSFQVYVDGKPNQMISANPSIVFKMMPASSVKDISVITNPGVRFDAEGVGGILQITTNREVTGGQSVAEGAYGTLTAQASTRGGGANYSDLRSDMLDQHNYGWSGNGLLGFQQTLPWDLRFSANAILMSRTQDLQGWSTGISLGTLGLTKTFLDDRLSISLSAVSPLSSKSLAIESHSETKEFISDMSMAVPIRQASFSLSWTFGKQGNYGVKKARRTISNDDVINTQSTAETLNGSGALGM